MAASMETGGGGSSAKTTRNRRILKGPPALGGLGPLVAVVLGLGLVWERPSVGTPPLSALSSPNTRGEECADDGSPLVDANYRFSLDLARNDIRGALRTALDHHLATVRDYACTFIKQERLAGRLGPEQVMEARFRQHPFSVMLHWVRNMDRVERVVYVAGRWIDQNAERPEERDLAICQPGAIARIFVKSVKRPIRGREARAASRRLLDQFGFARGLELLLECAGPPDGKCRLEFKGQGRIDGRPTWVLERSPPLWNQNGERQYHAAVFHIDREWLVPVSLRLYGDAERTMVIGRYEYHNVRMNVGWTAADFEPETYGM